ncbi:minor capsid protein [Acrocarpospora sp. B8E8]|uniref:minor capsid protein n=1 Tax=Acrocarpospora sp. B8E8 TaxID=3153572 RepID=UPI00325F4640
MATLLEEFAALADLLGLGIYNADGSVGGDIFLSRVPDAPDRVLIISRYGGDESSLADDYDEPRLQFRTRGPADDVRDAEQWAEQVYDAFHGLGMRELPGGTWLQLMVGLQSGPIWIGQDKNDRPEYTVNFRAEVSRASTNRSNP